MKNIFKNTSKRFLILLSLILFTVGCSDFLDKQPEDIFLGEEYWTSVDNVKNFAWLNYDTFYGYGNSTTIGLSFFYYHGSDNRIDDNLAAFSFYQMPINASTTDTYSWNEYYTLIRRCNLMIEKTPTVEGDVTTKNHYLGVAKFFRAYTYFRLVQKFSNIPYFDRYMTANDPDIYKPASPRAEIIDKVIADLEEAITLLKEVDDTNVTVNKYTAYAVLSNVCLYEGTYRKYHLGQDGSAYLTKCKTASLGVMNNSKYKLASDWQSLYNSIELSGNTEVILAKRYVTNILMHSLQNYTNTTTVQYGMTKFAAESYVTKNGLPINQRGGNAQYLGDLTLAKFAKDKDPRFGKTINTNNRYAYNGNATTASSPGSGIYAGIYSVTGYIFQLYNNPNTTGTDVTTGGRNYTDCPLFTLGEVYLNYAEACAELGTITNADLNLSINKIRTRAGIQILTTDGTNAIANGVTIDDPQRDSALEQKTGVVNGIIWEIRRERRVEFMSYTTMRQADIFRWKKGYYLDSTINPDVSLGARIKTTETPLVGTKVTVNADGYINAYTKGVVRNFTDKHYLLSIPTNEINLYKAEGVELKQNPGW